jgi:hypothetical protein
MSCLMARGRLGRAHDGPRVSPDHIVCRSGVRPCHAGFSPICPLRISAGAVVAGPGDRDMGWFQVGRRAGLPGYRGRSYRAVRRYRRLGPRRPRRVTASHQRGSPIRSAFRLFRFVPRARERTIDELAASCEMPPPRPARRQRHSTPVSGCLLVRTRSQRFLA